MDLFLQQQKKKAVNNEETVTVVLGNESCDLDSAISAIVYAYLIYKMNQNVGVVIPVFNIDREDVPLRTEVVYFLKKMGLSTEDILSKDEINLQKLKIANKLRLILVDHNSLSDEQSILQESIHEIIDHHKVHDPQLFDKCKAKVENVGSCCTLVAEELLKSPHFITEQIALLLIGTILLDTVCLQEEAKRVTQKDKDIVNLLKPFLNEINENKIFEELQAAKFDISNLTASQLLRKDIKYISYESIHVAIPSLPTLLEDALKEEDIYSGLSELSLKKHLDFVVVMSIKMSGDGYSIRRQLAIFDKSKKFLHKVSNYLLSLENPSLELQPLPLKNNFVLLFDQKNSALSRKFVLPAIQTFLQSLTVNQCLST